MRYFGTDGIRRNATFFDDAFLSKYASAVACLPNAKRIVIGRDTRPSGKRMEKTLALLLSSFGVETIVAGVLPSPALAFCVRKYDCSYGIMITASHNPPSDNGLKLFSSTGAKVSEKEEEFLEERILSPCFIPYRKADVLVVDGRKTYLDELLSTHAFNFNGKRILLDCAYGAATDVAAPLFRAFGAEVVAVCDENAGEKINVRCGATYPDNLFDLSSRFDLAFSYDGDADRVLAVQNDTLFSGDDILYFLSLFEKENGMLHNNAVCGTEMTNSGYENAYLKQGISFFRSAVGDRNLHEKMLAYDVYYGAETSGHVLLRRYAETGDGILTSLLLTDLTMKTDLTHFPRVRKMPSVENVLSVTPYEKERFLQRRNECVLPSFPSVRTVVRASGTENKIRFLCESEEKENAQTASNELMQFIRGILV